MLAAVVLFNFIKNNEKMKKETTILSEDDIPSTIQLEEEYRQFIVEQDHPCIMTQTVFKMGAVEVHSYKSFGTKKTADFFFFGF